MADPAAGPADLRPQPNVTALVAALSLGGHAALREASTPAILQVVIAAYGDAGSPALLAALAAGRHAALRLACARDHRQSGIELWMARYMQESNRSNMVRLLFQAYGGEGSAALSVALAAVGADCLLAASRLADAPLIALLVEAFGGPGSEGLLAALAAGGGRHARHAALLQLAGGGLDARRHDDADAEDVHLMLEDMQHAKNRLFCGYGERGVAALVRAAAAEGGELLEAFLCHETGDFQILCSVLRCPDAWQPGIGGREPLARRHMYSAAARARLALPVLCALRTLPKGVAGPMLAFLRQRSWLLYATDCECPEIDLSALVVGGFDG
jgi:hypothetical protein